MPFLFNPLTWQFNAVQDAINLGAAFQGVYNAGTTYTLGQAVSHDGNLYICLQPALGRDPDTTPAYWDDITMRGSPGATGAPGSSGNQVTVRAGRILGGQRAVLLDSGGSAVYADSSDVSHAGRFFGITSHAANNGDSVIVKIIGEMIEPSWVLDISLPVFLGVNGQLTQVPPSTGFMQVLGQPITTQSLFLDPKPSIKLA